jgi:hypothetical protein
MMLKPKMVRCGTQREVRKVCVKWNDGSYSLEKLALMKEGNPIEVAEYAMANKLSSEPAFNWWVNDVLRRRERILSRLNTRYMRREENLNTKKRQGRPGH